MSKSFLRDVVNFWQSIPKRWLQERAKGSKNEHGIIPRRAFCGVPLPSTLASSDAGGLAGYTQVDMLGVWCKFVNLGAVPGGELYYVTLILAKISPAAIICTPT